MKTVENIKKEAIEAHMIFECQTYPITGVQ